MSQHPSSNKVKRSESPSFLTLPIEIRLQIYEKLLVSQFNRADHPLRFWEVGRTNQNFIVIDKGRYLPSRTMEPQILQTCKQVYHEASSLLYSQNAFSIRQPEQMFRFIKQVGLPNLALIRRLNLWVSDIAGLEAWLELLKQLAEHASGLRRLEVQWSVESRQVSGSIVFWHRGLGENLEFVRALGKIQGLEPLVISGYYAKNWPAYLREKTGAQVECICGYGFEERGTCDSNLEEMPLMRERAIRMINARELRWFNQYQQGTEHLVP